MNPNNYKAYSTQLPGVTEALHHVLWDTQLFTSNLTIQLTYFTATRATVDLSNMETAGQLPYPKAFLIRAIKVQYKSRPESVNAVAATNPQTGSINNIALLMNCGVLELTVGSKQYGKIPLWKISSSGGPFGSFHTSNVLIGGGYADLGNGGYPHSNNGHTLPQPLFIEPQTNFKVDIYWGAVSVLTRNLNICVALEGDLLRAAQ